MRGRTLVQFLSAVELLARPFGATIEDLQQHLAVDRRSVYRMLEAIQQLGFPLYDEQDPSIRRKRWRFEDSYLRKLPNIALPEFRLTPSELVALFLLRCGSGLFKDTGIDRHIESAFNKFTSLLPKEGMMGRIEGLQALFISSAKLTKDLSKSGPVIEDLTFAMIRGVTCRVLYHSYSDDIEKRFMMNPLHFFERSGGLYLLTSRSERKGVRTLAVERIKEVELTSACFEYPEGFDADRYLDSVFDVVDGEPLEVAIRFSADQARYIRERKWSNDQEIADEPDGSVILRMNVWGLYDVTRWVLSWGSSAVVLEPQILRQKISEEARSITAQYSRR